MPYPQRPAPGGRGYPRLVSPSLPGRDLRRAPARPSPGLRPRSGHWTQRFFFPFASFAACSLVGSPGIPDGNALAMSDHPVVMPCWMICKAPDATQYTASPEDTCKGMTPNIKGIILCLVLFI